MTVSKRALPVPVTTPTVMQATATTTVVALIRVCFVDITKKEKKKRIEKKRSITQIEKEKLLKLNWR